MKKLQKSEFPLNHSENDFSCFGPPAIQDGNFEDAFLVDLGCFNQENVDSNKFYFACVTQSKKDGKWYAFFQWGRVGAKLENSQFQFLECESKQNAQLAMATQCHSKNDKRGIWTTIAGIKTLTAKPGKDVYKVQSLQSRSTGLPDARNITASEGLKTQKIQTKSSIPAQKHNVDTETVRLLQDLRVGTISYTRTTLEGGTIPSQSAIDEGRAVLLAAMSRLPVVGDDVDAQINDKDIKDLTFHLYSRIPKKKNLKDGPETWILSKNTIPGWQQNLDAFESAIYSNNQIEETNVNPFGDLPLISMEWLSPKSDLGRFIHTWLPGASLNRHHHVGNMTIKNVWKIERKEDKEIFIKGLNRCKVSGKYEKPILQASSRPDLDTQDNKLYNATNTHLLFHGTRSVNVSGILRTMLRFPKDLPAGIRIAGAMYSGGSGASYFADDWRKSAGYTSLNSSIYAHGSGAVSGRSAFMFLMDCSLGNPYTAPRAFPFPKPPDGHHCVFGKANHSGVMNNEWVIFDRDQVFMKYLVEFETNR